MHFEMRILVESILLILILTASSEELPSDDGNETDGVRSTILSLLRSENEYEVSVKMIFWVGFVLT